MAHPLMPKATAVWLVENTTLTFDQIADFCGLHELEVQAIADDEVAIGMHGLNPITAGELTAAEIDRCAADTTSRLAQAKPTIELPKPKKKGARYTPVSKRQDRPDAIAWLLKNYPELSDAQISRVIGTTKPTINSVRERSHWNSPNIKPQNPIGLGLCTEAALQKVVDVARARKGIVHGADAAPDATTTVEAAPAADIPKAGPAVWPTAVTDADTAPQEPAPEEKAPGSWPETQADEAAEHKDG